ncbi:hypothetical protein BG418_31180 [Streptomyces sp. CBMA152]|nr:hypothetical protein [Streptomyces sp. CBMA152]
MAGDPSHIGPYRLLGRLGAGGMGRVYLARSAGGRTVAVKLVQEQYANEPEFRQRFAREVAAARRVGGEWTAHVLDADVSASVPWVATSYVAGPSLQTVVDRDFGPLPSASLLVLANRLALALAAIHSAGLVHRDLKPANILLAVDGPRVIDFGITRALTGTDGLTRTGIVIGSLGFMSPEQVRGERVSAASDVFCLGAVLAFAATGRAPFGGLSEGHAGALLYRIAHGEPDLRGVPESLLPLVRACLHKDAARRPTPEELAEATASDVPAHGWLPAELLAQLARRSGELLDADMSPVPPPRRRAQTFRPPVPTPEASGRADPPPPPPPAAYTPGPSPRVHMSGPKNRSRRRIRVAVAVLAALVLGWFAVRPLVVSAINHDSGSPSPSPSLGSPTFDFTGVWEGASSGSAVRVTVARDQPGGSVEVDTLDDVRMCGGTTSVLGRKGPTLKVTALATSTDEIESVGFAAGGCQSIQEQSLEAEADGTVLWSAGSQYTALLKRAEHSDAALPGGFVGHWQRSQGAPGDASFSVTLTQGALGKPLIHGEETTSKGACSWTAVLFRVRDGQRLDFAPMQLSRGDSRTGCTDDVPRTYWLQGGTLWLEPVGVARDYVAFRKTG